MPGNNTSRAKNELTLWAHESKNISRNFLFIPLSTPPRWLCRVGDFRSIEEADAMMRQLRATGVFKEVSIVKEQINIPIYKNLLMVRKRRNRISCTGWTERTLSAYYNFIGRRCRTRRTTENPRTCSKGYAEFDKRLFHGSARTAPLCQV